MTPPVKIKLMQERVFKYAEVESAIASIHNISPAALKTFRSRIKHFQRIGVVPFSPGRGQKIDYKIIDVIRWALCFEFAELGLPPDQIKLIIRFCEQTLLKPFTGPLLAEDWIFCMRADILEWHLDAAAVRASGGETLWAPPPSSYGVVPVSEINKMFSMKKGALFARALLVNLTQLKRELGKNLNIDWS